MPVYCCIKSCNNNSIHNRDLKFYEFPKVWTRTPELRKLSEIRTNKWFAAINRKNLNTKTSRVCSVHFHSGRCAQLTDRLSLDWVPSLHLSKPEGEVSSSSEDEDMNDESNENQEEFLEEYLNVYKTNVETKAEPKRKRIIRPINCCVPNCKNVRPSQQSNIKFFRFPSAKQKINGKIIPKSERLTAWILAINRIDITNLNARYKIICSEHFNSGAPSKAGDKSHPDWIPNQKLPTTLTRALKRTSGPSISSPTANKPSIQSYESDLVENYDPLAEEEIQMQVSDSEIEGLTNFESEDLKKEIEQLRHENGFLNKRLVDKDNTIIELNTKYLRLLETHKIQIREKDARIQLLESTNTRISLSQGSFKIDDKKVNYFTGLPSYAVLEIIYNFVEQQLVCCLKKGVNKFDALILVLMKLRFDLPLTYIGYRYCIAGNTTATIFHSNLKMLSKKIGPFIRWPEKAALRENTPAYFKRILGNKFTALLDFIEDPEESIIEGEYTKYKYLIAISPAGAIIYVSKGYNNSLSLKEIAESCGVLDYTEDGDIILTERGLTKHQVCTYNGSKVLVQSANEENDLLDTLLQNTTASNKEIEPEADKCRIFLQKSIPNLRNKFFVLSNKYKVALLKSYKNNEEERYFDFVLKVCCALTNVSPALLSFETKKS
ncbi:uncharacterized protein LOC129942597 isoform X2 [Eupeodes corollae]|uniref:uncharacterized protein LOC129942597 isoform X2 n=1 Tax=Eupeodes corollae TaxID=290404 RepID=UPI0024915816|nr:uncharacterized protein LOC129942597 isoform X2 [Eupeodes corollae]